MATSSTIMIKAIMKHTLYIGTSLIVLLPINSFALTLQQSLTLPLSLEYESNPRLSSNNQQSARRTTLIPAYTLMATQGNDQFSIDLGLNIERSSNQSASADREDPSVGLGWSHTYETGQYGLTANFSEQSTRISEFDDTGLSTNDNTRQSSSIGGNWSTALSDRYTFTLNGNVTKAEFDNTTASLNDFKNKNVNAQLGYSVNEQIESYVRVAFSRFEPATGNKSNTRSIVLGADWDMSEQLSVNGNLGINKTGSDSGWQAMLDANYMTARTQTQFGLSRSRSPSSAGIINESNQLSAAWSYDLSEKESVGVSFNYQENLSANESETMRLSASYTRALAPEWDFSVSAQHRNRNDATSDVSSNTLTATIIYKLSDF